jgi:hypothetical protein
MSWDCWDSALGWPDTILHMVWLIVLALGVMGALIGRIMARADLPPLAQSVTIGAVACVASLSFSVRFHACLRELLRPPIGSGGIFAVSSGCAEALVETFSPCCWRSCCGWRGASCASSVDRIALSRVRDSRGQELHDSVLWDVRHASGPVAAGRSPMLEMRRPVLVATRRARLRADVTATALTAAWCAPPAPTPRQSGIGVPDVPPVPRGSAVRPRC